MVASANLSGRDSGGVALRDAREELAIDATGISGDDPSASCAADSMEPGANPGLNQQARHEIAMLLG